MAEGTPRWRRAPCVSPLAWRPSLRLFFAVGVFLCVSACADLKGIEAFGKMAPDPSTILGLTKIYVQELDVREDIKLLGDDPPNPELAAGDASRVQEAKGIQGADRALHDYMQALVALANGSIVQSSTSSKSVTGGLTSLQKSHPALDLTNSQISIIGDFVQSLADLAESGYRNAKLVEIIRRSDAPLQQLLATQAGIVTQAIMPSIQETQRSLKERAIGDGFKYIDEDLRNWFIKPGSNAPAEKTAASEMFDRRNPTYRGQGETDAHVARYLLKKSIDADQAALSAELATAAAYTKALQKIGDAHRKLVAVGKGVLTKEMVQQIQPLANEVHKDFQDLETLESGTRKD